MAHEYETMIIGGGPAGLSTAASIVRQDYKTVLFDSGVNRNSQSKYMHTVPTWDHAGPQAFRQAAIKDFERYGSIDIEKTKVDSIRKREDGMFEAVGGWILSSTEATAAGSVWTGKKIVLATGVEDVFPDIPGYAKCWISGIFHCSYCHGWEEKGSETAGIIAVGEIGNVLTALHFARQALPMAKQVNIYTNGDRELALSLQMELDAAPAPMSVEHKKIANLVKESDRARVTIHFEDGSIVSEAFLAHKPKIQLRGDLWMQLGCELSPKKLIAVNPPFNQTTVKGVFAAGDCSNPMQTVTSSLSSGTCADGGAPLQLQAETYKQQALF